MQLEIFLAINFSVFKHISVAFAQCTNAAHVHFNVDNDAYSNVSLKGHQIAIIEEIEREKKMHSTECTHEYTHEKSE